MQNLLLLSLFLCAQAIPTEPMPPALNKTKASIELGGACDQYEHLCEEGLVCQDKKCVCPRSKEGEKCGGFSRHPPECIEGLECVFEAGVADQPGTCRKMCKLDHDCSTTEECVWEFLPDKTRRNICMSYATQGETCNSKPMRRHCAKGYECLNKVSHAEDGVQRCYKQDTITVAKEGEPCEGKTSSICPPGFRCSKSNEGKICKRNPLPKRDNKSLKEGEICKSSEGKNKGNCAAGLVCVTTRLNNAQSKSICQPYAVQGELCADESCSHPCAEGYECLNKTPQMIDSFSRCYMKGIKTVAAEGEGCKGDTNSICAPGLKCVDHNRIGKWCVKQDTKETPASGGKKTAKEGELCGGIAGILCDTELECEIKTKGTPDAAGKCIKPSKEEKKYEKEEVPKADVTAAVEPEEKKDEPKADEEKKDEEPKADAAAAVEPEEKKDEPKADEEKKDEEPKADAAAAVEPEEKKDEPKADEEKKDEEPKADATAAVEPEEKKDEPKADVTAAVEPEEKKDEPKADEEKKDEEPKADVTAAVEPEEKKDEPKADEEKKDEEPKADVTAAVEPEEKKDEPKADEEKKEEEPKADAAAAVEPEEKKEEPKADEEKKDEEPKADVTAAVEPEEKNNERDY